MKSRSDDVWGSISNSYFIRFSVVFGFLVLPEAEATPGEKERFDLIFCLLMSPPQIQIWNKQKIAPEYNSTIFAAMGEAKQSTGPLRKDGQDRILQYYVDIQLRWRHLHLESKNMVLAELKSYHLSTALCSYPLVKMEIGDSSQIFTTAAIFFQYDYFRQTIWRLASVQFHFWYIFGD